MLLEKITVQNFRCHERVVDLPIHKLTIFIGENDSGKTALLDAICILLTSKSPTSSDFRQISSDHKADEIVVSGVFKVEEHDSVPLDLCSPEGGKVILTKRFQEKTSVCEVECLGFEDQRFNSFDSQQAVVQRNCLRI